jgi:hypothetical protein
LILLDLWTRICQTQGRRSRLKSWVGRSREQGVGDGLLNRCRIFRPSQFKSIEVTQLRKRAPLHGACWGKRRTGGGPLDRRRSVDHIADAVDLVFRFGALKDSTLIARRILTYRHQLVASRAYLENCKPPKAPQDLLGHRLLAFSHWKPENSWSFVNANGRDKKTLTFKPYLSMNDYTGLAHALLAGAGIGDLPPVVQPDLLRDGRLVEVMPKWRFRGFNLSVIHLGNRHIPKPVRLFKEFASQMAPKLSPMLPT